MAEQVSFTLTEGQKVGAGRFTLIRVLGRGGMGVVWLARDSRFNDQEVALKFLPPDVAADATALHDLRRETRQSRTLSHANILRLHDFFEAPDEPAFISMEYVDGPNLASLRVQQSPACLEWEYLQPLIVQLCQALEYAHNENIVHRDLKPANLMVDSRGRLKLTDFGIAATITDSSSRISLSHTGSGTVIYMSPQQMRGEKPAPSDDIYALGASLYELLGSRPPFYQGGAVAIMNQVLNEPPQPLMLRLAEEGISNPFPEWVANTIMACLAKDPADRPENARAALDRLLGNPPPIPTRPPMPAPDMSPLEEDDSDEPKPFPIKILIGIIALIVCLSLAGTGYWIKLWSKPRPVAVVAEPPAPQTNLAPVEVIPLMELARWTNSMGQILVLMPGTRVMFSAWDTRVQDFQAFVDATGYDATNGMLSMGNDGWKSRGDNWKTPGFVQGPTQPVVGVNWDDAQAYCKWLTTKERAGGLIRANQSYRLPTDAEWSVAVGNTVYPWGNTWPPGSNVVNYAGAEALGNNWASSYPVIPNYRDTFPRTSPVGSFSPNAFGLYDMGGNVWQWCDDWYYKEMNTTEALKSFRQVADDGGGQAFRVIRGGSWKNGGNLAEIHSSFRQREDPKVRRDNNGFRCVLTIGE